MESYLRSRIHNVRKVPTVFWGFIASVTHWNNILLTGKSHGGLIILEIIKLTVVALCRPSTKSTSVSSELFFERTRLFKGTDAEPRRLPSKNRFPS